MVQKLRMSRKNRVKQGLLKGPSAGLQPFHWLHPGHLPGKRLGEQQDGQKEHARSVGLKDLAVHPRFAMCCVTLDKFFSGPSGSQQKRLQPDPRKNSRKSKVMNTKGYCLILILDGG